MSQQDKQKEFIEELALTLEGQDNLLHIEAALREAIEYGKSVAAQPLPAAPSATNPLLEGAEVLATVRFDPAAGMVEVEISRPGEHAGAEPTTELSADFKAGQEDAARRILACRKEWDALDLSTEEIDQRIAEGFGISGVPKMGDTVCQTCGMPNPSWFIDTKYWRLVHPEDSGVLCLRCFAEEAAGVGVTGCWKLVPDEITNSLVLGKTPIQRRIEAEAIPPSKVAFDKALADRSSVAATGEKKS